MKLRRLLISLIILIILAGNFQIIRGDSVQSNLSDRLIPPLSVTFKAKINHTDDSDLHAPEYNQPTGFILFDDKICFDSYDGNSLYIMNLNNGKIVWSYQAETKISSYDGWHKYEGLMLVQLDYRTEPPVGAHTWPTGSGAVIAVDMGTKEVVWKFPTKNSGILHLQARDGVVYFIANYEGIYALDASTGKVKWLYPELPDPESSSGAKGFTDLVLAQDAIYASASGVLLTLDRSTGKERSRFNLGNASVTSAMNDLVLANNILYGNIYEYYDTNKILNYSFVAFDPLAEHFLWKTFRSPFPGGGHSEPIVTNDSIYVTWSEHEKKDQFGDFLNRVYSLDLSTGEVRWQSDYGLFSWTYSRAGMVLDEPYLYVKGGENVPYMTEYGLRYAPYATLTAFDTRTGTRVWNYTLNRERGASWAYEGILSSDGTGTKTIYLISHEGYPLPEPVGPEQIVSDTEYLVYGFSSSSAQDVPEFPITLITLAISVSIIPLVFRKRKSGRMIGQ